MTYFFVDPNRAAALLNECATWEGTRFAAFQRMKNGGVDCIQLVAAVMIATGAIAEESCTLPTFYRLDWGVASDHSLIEDFIESTRRTVRFPGNVPAQIGDIIGFRIGRCIQHCGIALDSRRFIHAMQLSRVKISYFCDSTWSERIEAVWRPTGIEL